MIGDKDGSNFFVPCLLRGRNWIPADVHREGDSGDWAILTEDSSVTEPLDETWPLEKSPYWLKSPLIGQNNNMEMSNVADCNSSSRFK